MFREAVLKYVQSRATVNLTDVAIEIKTIQTRPMDILNQYYLENGQGFTLILLHRHCIMHISLCIQFLVPLYYIVPDPYYNIKSC